MLFDLHVSYLREKINKIKKKFQMLTLFGTNAIKGVVILIQYNWVNLMIKSKKIECVLI